MASASKDVAQFGQRDLLTLDFHSNEVKALAMADNGVGA